MDGTLDASSFFVPFALRELRLGTDPLLEGTYMAKLRSHFLVAAGFWGRVHGKKAIAAGDPGSSSWRLGRSSGSTWSWRTAGRGRGRWPPTSAAARPRRGRRRADGAGRAAPGF